MRGVGWWRWLGGARTRSLWLGGEDAPVEKGWRAYSVGKERPGKLQATGFPVDPVRTLGTAVGGMGEKACGWAAPVRAGGQNTLQKRRVAPEPHPPALSLGFCAGARGRERGAVWWEARDSFPPPAESVPSPPPPSLAST